MGKQEKPGIAYFFLAGLTLLFLCGAFFLNAEGRRAASAEAGWVVETSRETEERTVPERVYVNVNTASAEELEALTGIGPTLAQAIVDYRTEHGAFEAPEELLNVKGIGEKKLEAIRRDIVLSDGAEKNEGGETP